MLKPGFFTNPELAALPESARLLFAGLWTLADRDGRLLDRPSYIHGQLFPHDHVGAVDCEALLKQLRGAGFIERYRAKGMTLIAITQWHAHQHPHFREPVSKLPPKSEPRAQPSAEPGGGSSLGSLGSLGINTPPPSGGGCPFSVEKVPAPQPSGEPFELKTAPQGSGKLNGKHVLPSCPHRDLLALWGEILPQLPQHNPDLWAGAREAQLRTRWRETAKARHWATQADGLAYFRALFGYVGRSHFLTGRAKYHDERHPFLAELAWIVEPGNWAKVIEGRYHEGTA
jgi:hypothetical protein